MGSGTIGTYAINSDSTGHTFVDCLTSSETTELTRLASHPAAQALEAVGEGAVALKDAGTFLGLVGDTIRNTFERHVRSRLMQRHRVEHARQTAHGWLLTLTNIADGETCQIAARNLLIATGAHQPTERLAKERVAGVSLLHRYGDKLLQSDEALSHDGLDRLTRTLESSPSPRVAIVGGSTSAVSLPAALLRGVQHVRFGKGGITLLHRRPMRVYYPTRAATVADGYTEWTDADVCPISGRVFRFAGFRLDSRELIMAARGIGGRAPETCFRLHQLQPDDPEAIGIMDDADLIVAALGYRPRGLRLFDASGDTIRLHSETGWTAPMVDVQCRVLDAEAQPIPGLFGMGLAAGYLPRGRFGGEASFRGQANGLWLWQTDVGLLIVTAVLASRETSQAASYCSWPA